MATKNGTTAAVNRIADDERGSSGRIEIHAPRIQVVDVPIVGTTPLIVHAWSEKSRKEMLDKQMGATKRAKEKKDPHADYMASRYIADAGWDGVPAVAFKAAMVGACRTIDDFPMTLAKRLFRVRADGRSTGGTLAVDLVRIIGEPRMRKDMVRVAGGTADIRFRAEFPEWSAVIGIEFNASMVSAEQVINLLALAGYSEGICEWRPSAPKSATGSYGCWRIQEGSI